MYFQMCQLLIFSDLERANAIDRIAQKVYLTYQMGIGDTAVRRGLPPLQQIRSQVVKICMKRFPKSYAKILGEHLEIEKKRKKKSKESRE